MVSLQKRKRTNTDFLSLRQIHENHSFSKDTPKQRDTGDVLSSNSIFIPKDFSSPQKKRIAIKRNIPSSTLRRPISGPFLSHSPIRNSKLSSLTSHHPELLCLDEKYHKICTKLVLRPKIKRVIMKNSEIQADIQF